MRFSTLSRNVKVLQADTNGKTTPGSHTAHSHVHLLHDRATSFHAA